MKSVFRLVEKIARTNATVLIGGESGSGKEVVARALHNFSLRCERPWVDINCGALPDHLVESELFGYEKGAFSGADGQKAGMFELANGGTSVPGRDRRTRRQDAGETAARARRRAVLPAGRHAQGRGGRAHRGRHEQKPREGRRGRNVSRAIYFTG